MSSWRNKCPRDSFNNGYQNYSTWNYKKLNKNNCNKYSAGILPYTFNLQGQLLFLLGKDAEGDWSDFGGKCEFRDKNEPINTATREFYEETLGAVLDISSCIEKINASPNGNKVISKTLNGSPYYMYLVYVDYMNYTENFNKTSNFLKYHYFDNQVSLNKVIEKNDIRWVNLDTLLNCIDNKQSNLIPLRGVFFKTIENCKDKLINLITNIRHHMI